MNSQLSSIDKASKLVQAFISFKIFLLINGFLRPAIIWLTKLKQEIRLIFPPINFVLSIYGIDTTWVFRKIKLMPYWFSVILPGIFLNSGRCYRLRISMIVLCIPHSQFTVGSQVDVWLIVSLSCFMFSISSSQKLSSQFKVFTLFISS